MFLFFLLFCFALVACALIAVALQRFKSTWQSATDGHMSQHAGNNLSIFPLYCSVILYVALQRIIYCQSATDVSQHGGNIDSIILWFGIFPHCNISILFLIPIPCKAVKLSIVCIFELKSCTRVTKNQPKDGCSHLSNSTNYAHQAVAKCIFSCRGFFDV